MVHRQHTIQRGQIDEHPFRQELLRAHGMPSPANRERLAGLCTFRDGSSQRVNGVRLPHALNCRGVQLRVNVVDLHAMSPPTANDELACIINGIGARRYGHAGERVWEASCGNYGSLKRTRNRVGAWRGLTRRALLVQIRSSVSPRNVSAVWPPALPNTSAAISLPRCHAHSSRDCAGTGSVASGSGWTDTRARRQRIAHAMGLSPSTTVAMVK